jgi:hypothetical protein
MGAARRRLVELALCALLVFRRRRHVRWEGREQAPAPALSAAAVHTPPPSLSPPTPPSAYIRRGLVIRTRPQRCSPASKDAATRTTTGAGSAPLTLGTDDQRGPLWI